MNRTTNYNLCQFEASDQVQRTDFNEDNAKIDAAIAAEADARQSGDGSLSSRISSLSSTVSGKASQSALNTVKNQVAKLGNCQLHYATYKGNNTQTLTLSFPRLPYLTRLINLSDPVQTFTLVRGAGRGVSDNAVRPSYASVTWSGNSFTAALPDTDLNRLNCTYAVIAFMDAGE